MYSSAHNTCVQAEIYVYQPSRLYNYLVREFISSTTNTITPSAIIIRI